MSKPPPTHRPNNVSEPPIVVPPVSASPQYASDAFRGVPPSRPPANAMHWSSLLHKRWAVLVLLFGATAALGLPLLWRSRGFTRTEKWIWTVLVVLYTVVVFWLFFLVMWWSYINIRESLA